VLFLHHSLVLLWAIGINNLQNFKIRGKRAKKRGVCVKSNIVTTVSRNVVKIASVEIQRSMEIYIESPI